MATIIGNNVQETNKLSDYIQLHLKLQIEIDMATVFQKL